MTMAPKFDELALKYVLAERDESDQRQAIAEQAAQIIEESTNKRITIGQWVASVSRWMQSSGEDDLISRAKALDFLADTLQVLSRTRDTLKADQVKLLVTFFCSLFENDHKAGIAASSKALRQLIETKHFQPTLSNEVIRSICKLGDDFKLQVPATRLEIYHIFRYLLESPVVAHELKEQHDSTSGFISDLLNLCRNERDPENLMIWFGILKILLQEFKPSADATSEIFKSFSAYFPISLRPSATPSTITTDDLKSTLRSCFSAHHCIAGLSIPFLVDKLDKVDQTVAVKVDILSTLEECLANYDDPKQTVVPYADQIWSSLKYEVRNGEIQDIIKATLKVLCSLTKRLDGDDLRLFLDNAWRDLREDITDSRYTAQAGRLLVAIVSATSSSFALLIPRALEHVKQTIKHNTSVLHTRHLVALTSSVLKLRLHLVSDVEWRHSQVQKMELLSDDLFGDSLFNDLYMPLWEEYSNQSSPIEHIGILREAMQGLGALVGQKSSGQGPIQRLCSDATCETIFGLLAKPVIICPLKGSKYFSSADDRVPQDLLDAGEETLKNAVPLYPPAFRYLLLQYLTSFQDAYQLQTRPHDLSSQIRKVSTTLCQLIHSDELDPHACWLNEVALVNTFAQGLEWMSSKQADPKYLVVFIDAIHLTFKRSLRQGPKWDNSPALTNERLREVSHVFKANEVLPVDINQPEKTDQPNTRKAESCYPRRAFYLFAVQHLYQRFTTLTKPLEGDDTPVGSRIRVALTQDMDGSDHDQLARQDILLNQLGQLATSVIRALSEDDQKALELDSEAFHLFHTRDDIPKQQAEVSWSVSSANDFRTAPLSLGIVQGLWPRAVRIEVHRSALNNTIDTLIVHSTPRYEPARAAMDALLCVISNKADVKTQGVLAEERLRAQQALTTTTVAAMLSGDNQITEGVDSRLQILRSVLHYLAGDVARPLMGPDQNSLLALIVEHGVADITMGRQLARNLGLLVAPREGLSDINHAIRKKLGLGWFYHKNVVPYLDRCFVGTEVTEAEAVNRAVGTFAILRHLDYGIYASEVARIVRAGVQSLSTFQAGMETESLLVVLLHILEKDPSELREHLTALIKGLIVVYETSRSTVESGTARTRARNRDSIATRMYTLQFFQKLTESGYDAHLLVPHRRGLLRPLATACGDSVREIRRASLKARQAWEGLN